MLETVDCHLFYTHMHDFVKVFLHLKQCFFERYLQIHDWIRNAILKKDVRVKIVREKTKCNAVEVLFFFSFHLNSNFRFNYLNQNISLFLLLKV